MIAIFCNVSADEAWLMYWHEPEHPVCQRILKKRPENHFLYEADMHRENFPAARKEETNGRL